MENHFRDIKIGIQLFLIMKTKDTRRELRCPKHYLHKHRPYYTSIFFHFVLIFKWMCKYNNYLYVKCFSAVLRFCTHTSKNVSMSVMSIY